MTKQKVDPATRHEAIIRVALDLAARVGFRNVTREVIASHAGVATGTVSYHYKKMADLRNEIVRRAVQDENAVVVAQAMAEGHKLTKNVPLKLKHLVAQLMIS